MPKERVEAVKNVTEEALSEVKTRLEKMPAPGTQVTDPNGGLGMNIAMAVSLCNLRPFNTNA